MLNELIPAGARKFVYLAFALIGAALTAATVGYSELDLASPDWLRVAGAVYYSLGASLGLLAAHNVLKKDKSEPAAADVAGLAPVARRADFETQPIPGADYDLDEGLS